MWKSAMTYEEAIVAVRTKRGIVEPNPGFKKQLKKFEQKK
jgi:hypothetical protein